MIISDANITTTANAALGFQGRSLKSQEILAALPSITTPRRAGMNSAATNVTDI